MFVDFSKAFDSIHRGKIEQIIPAYAFSKETVTAVMTLYKDTKTMVFLPDVDTDFFDVVTEVLQRDTLAPFIFIICQEYELRTSTDFMLYNGFTLIIAVTVYLSTIVWLHHLDFNKTPEEKKVRTTQGCCV